MKRTMLMAALGLGLAAPAFADLALATSKNCMSCHAVERKVLGPSFKDIAAKYKGQDVAAKLFDKVRKGGSGVFGPIPMSPNGADKIADQDLKDAIAVILKS